MNQTKISKLLSYVLRHKPESINITLDKNWWANIEKIIQKFKEFESIDISYQQIKKIVEENDKQRFSISEDQKMIRANQWHSINVDLNLKPITPPEFLYHGTATRFLESIKEKWLVPMNRQFVHLSSDLETAKNVWTRHWKPVVLKILSKKLHENGHNFYISENWVWLCSDISPEFIEFF